MKIKKIGVTTGEPFAETGCIILKGDTSFYKMYTKRGYWSNQASSYEKGLRQATLAEIESDWTEIKDQWDPQPGDLVRITSSAYKHTDDFVIEGQRGLPVDYWSVSYLDGNAYTNFNKNQMVLSPNHGWEANSTPEAITEPQPRWKVGDYVTYKAEKDCKDQQYHFAGICQGGYKGEITGYGIYKEEFNCFSLHVTTRIGYDFNMLESEFEEWDTRNFQNNVKPEPVIDKKVEFTIKDGVVRFDGHEVRVGDIVSCNIDYIRNPTGSLEKNVNIIMQKVLKIEKDNYQGNMPIYLSGACWCNIHKATNFVNHGQPTQPSQLTISDIKDSLQLVDSRLTINDVYYPSLSVNPIKKEKSVSDYQQKPVTLYKPKTKLSLKPIKL